jgi:gamma-glutamyl:cysteine ligase YbdK (ATP-grasp superfamily)
MPFALRLEGADALTELAAQVRRGYSDAAWLRECHTETGSLPDVAREAAARWGGVGHI